MRYFLSSEGGWCVEHGGSCAVVLVPSPTEFFNFLQKISVAHQFKNFLLFDLGFFRPLPIQSFRSPAAHAKNLLCCCGSCTIFFCFCFIFISFSVSVDFNYGLLIVSTGLSLRLIFETFVGYTYNRDVLQFIILSCPFQAVSCLSLRCALRLHILPVYVFRPEPRDTAEMSQESPERCLIGKALPGVLSCFVIH
jgi:hypothetical protein